jgi:hypothetical protein
MDTDSTSSRRNCLQKGAAASAGLLVMPPARYSARTSLVVNHILVDGDIGNRVVAEFVKIWPNGIDGIGRRSAKF